ncbi:WG repeat-containing protein [Acinetobacter haemolyticus]|uniref:WG repeat-containing protein n=1 Tax=Acinetobacter haemolyticus TaxID=29430 RepID=UPI0002CDE463|nr:WG repeat-containing protein [Acinetobacter haemolyticus]ENW19905.1 hypothetical protein F926_02003 [Acinetobacter haemolyticus NIPH 261]NAR57893.1 WG repeat-containing protein [Acinetobacter haemolyticus]NAR80311.1 WG repeat-containing protein [Acinetobacter haemolyticus]NAR89713.1 WG repeat-containing protein [Acinetobacter haemolyticus]NAS01860.1 WG repeat-containing protein [Acinetobacter haemolyticus]
MKQSPQKISMLFISALFSMDVLSNEPIYPIEKKNLLGFVNYTGDIVVKPQFDTGVVHFIGTGRDDLININKDGKRGILSTKGELVIPTIYDNDFNSFNFNKGNIASYTLNGKCGYINDKNEIITKNIYEKCSAFSEQRASVRLNNKWALIDQKGTLLSDFLYGEIDKFSEGLAAIEINGKYGYINTNGKIVIQPVHALALSFKDGMARIGSIYSPYYFIDKSGKKIFDVNFNHVYPFTGDYAVIRRDIGSNEYYGLIDKQGKIYIKPKFQDIKIDENTPNFAVIEISKTGKIKKGILDIKTQKMIVEPIYDQISISDEMIYFKNNGKYGWMNRKFEIIVPPQFDDILIGFGKGNIALVKLNEEMFYINKNGEKTINFYQ